MNQQWKEYIKTIDIFFSELYMNIKIFNKNFIMPEFSESQITERSMRVGKEVKKFDVDIFLDLKYFRMLVIATLKKDFIDRCFAIHQKKLCDIADHWYEKISNINNNLS